MDSIAAQKYKEWTKDLSSREAVISIFEHIRDIPYKVIPRQMNLKTGPGDLLASGEGPCTSKHYLMGQMFEKAGFGVRYLTYTFAWEKFKGIFPKELMLLTLKLPLTYHLACSIFLGGKWVLVDATWDAPLADAGFPVVKSWDGVSDTKLGVYPISEFVHDAQEEREEFVQRKMKQFSLSDKLELQRFSIALNKWLESLRQI